MKKIYFLLSVALLVSGIAVASCPDEDFDKKLKVKSLQNTVDSLKQSIARQQEQVAKLEAEIQAIPETINESQV